MFSCWTWKKLRLIRNLRLIFFNLKMKLSIPLVSPLLWRIFHVIFDMILPPTFHERVWFKHERLYFCIFLRQYFLEKCFSWAHSRENLNWILFLPFFTSMVWETNKVQLKVKVTKFFPLIFVKVSFLLRKISVEI